MMMVVWVAVAAGLSAWFMTGRLREYSLARAILDVPNARSSHSTPTPRGGGVAIVVLAVLTVGIVLVKGLLDTRAALALLGVIPIALIGWVDDVKHAPASHRALVQFAAAIWAASWLGGFDVLNLGVTQLRMPGIGSVIAVVGIVWVVNLYNFMDGIDGIAGVEAISIGAVSAVLLTLSGQPGLALVASVVAGSSAGFLWWNRAPARIFMGDVGSGSLGYIFAVIALFSEKRHALPLLAFAILAAVFIVDATLTVLRRLARGERWYDAHRSHAYQRAVQAGHSHSRVVVATAVINLLLAALVVVAWLRPAWLLAAAACGFAIVTAAYYATEKIKPMSPAASRASVAG